MYEVMIKLEELSLFSTLGKAEIKEIQPYFVEHKFAKREMIFSEGQPSDWLYIVQSGKVKITKLSQEGKEIILEIIPPMQFFGGVAVVRGFPYPANAVAIEPTVTLRIARANLLKVLDRFPIVMFSIVQSLGDRIKDFHESTKNIALEKVSARIAALILKLSEQSGHAAPEGVVIDMKLTKQDIAEMVGTTVETSIRTMSKFKKNGLVTEKVGKITIKDIEGLKLAAGA